MRTTLARLGRPIYTKRLQHNLEAASPRWLTQPSQQTSTALRFQLKEDGSRTVGGGLRLVKTEDSLYGVLGRPDAHIALRDACKCPRCIDQSTRQREFDFADIPADIQGKATTDHDGNWHVQWANDIPGFDDHVSTFTPTQIVDFKRNSKLSSTRLWDQETFKRETRTVKYDDFLNKDESHAQVLYLLARHGLIFVDNVPQDETSVMKLAERIGPLRNTFYGSSWNVRSKPQAENVAYTHKHLGFHMDLMYMKESPNVQLLHCLENSCTGGESRFVDTFKAFDVLLSENKELGLELLKAKILYEYDNNGHYYSDIKPIIEMARPMENPRRTMRGHMNNTLDFVRRVYWSPPFVGSIQSEIGERPDRIRDKLQASKAFADILERPELVYEEKMEPGTCMIFDNLRVLHARNAFDINSGKRWLRGCYVDGQDMLSKEISLSNHIEKLDREYTRRWGDQ